MFPHDVLSGISTLNYESPVSRCLCAQREIPWQRRPLHFFFCLPPFFFSFFFFFGLHFLPTLIADLYFSLAAGKSVGIDPTFSHL